MLLQLHKSWWYPIPLPGRIVSPTANSCKIDSRPNPVFFLSFHERFKMFRPVKLLTELPNTRTHRSWVEYWNSDPGRVQSLEYKRRNLWLKIRFSHLIRRKAFTFATDGSNDTEQNRGLDRHVTRPSYVFNSYSVLKTGPDRFEPCTK